MFACEQVHTLSRFRNLHFTLLMEELLQLGKASIFPSLFSEQQEQSLCRHSSENKSSLQSTRRSCPSSSGSTYSSHSISTPGLVGHMTSLKLCFMSTAPAQDLSLNPSSQHSLGTLQLSVIQAPGGSSASGLRKHLCSREDTNTRMHTNTQY